MARLAEDAKLLIVQRLAMFDTPSQIVEAVKEEFGVIVTRQQVEAYNATRNGKKPAKKWVAAFETTRARFLETTGDIPIANRAVRLRRLERMAIAAEQKKNFPLAAQLHEQAAKECGDFYTNTRKLSHSGAVAGGVLAVPVPITDEQWSAAASTQQAGLTARAGMATPRVEQ